MCPELLAFGPWSLAVLPIVIAVAYGLALLWLLAEQRWGGGKPLTVTRALIALVPAVAVGVLVFFLVNHFGPVKIKAWGTMLVVAFAVGTIYMARYGDRKVITPAECLDFSLYCLVGAVIGARVLFVVLDWGHYGSHLERLANVWEGGLSFHGGLLGALLAAMLFARLRRKSFLAIADVGAPGIALGYVFARIGCFLNGCCHGHESHLPWAMKFPHGELPKVLVHPTQLYAALASLAIFFILLRLRGRFARHGHLLLTYFALYSVYRFLAEFTRAGATGRLLHSVPWLTVAQLASLVILVLS
ncbi:MAG: prolipoprotein diacylglyceryl transferase, partial [Armatimonadetes bacterium]|nr:prolipoprotein diacylglyceryl transferase [Armatimonadota bacterium]